MACPFFFPTSKLNGGWLHPSRLPLGAGWLGQCCAPGHEGAEPTTEEVREFCNLGYAVNCPRLPKDRNADAVRFSILRDAGTQILVRFVCEFGHRPANDGHLEYEAGQQRWLGPHPDPRIQKMAECYLQAYLDRRATPTLSSAPTRIDA